MKDRRYAAYPEQFGGEIKGPNTAYSYRTTNKQFFHRRNAQLAWAVRLRAQRTRQLLRGDAVDPNGCLFIDPGVGRLEEYLAQLSQPVWDENTTGKVAIMKHDEDEPSPDLYDATGPRVRLGQPLRPARAEMMREGC